MKSKTNIIYPAFALCAFVCFGLSPRAQAACQDGCLTNQNTVLGDDALLNNTGVDNIAIGFHALFSNTSGFANNAIGSSALFSNTDGAGNTAIGNGALFSNTEGDFNISIGGLENNTTGTSNTAVGGDALAFNTIGNSNVAVGQGALQNSSGSTNTALGFNAGINLTTGSNDIYIGNVGVASESRTIRIGTRQTHRTTFIAGISGATVPTGVPVIVDATGHLGTTTSSARFKEAIKPMDKVSEAILALNPVTFHYKKELDPEGIAQFGLVAEDVEKVNPALVARDADGKPYTVRYEAVNAMLLNEFLKAHQKIEEQEHTIAQLKATIAEQMEAVTARLKEHDAQIQKVSAQLEASHPAPRIAANDQ